MRRPPARALLTVSAIVAAFLMVVVGGGGDAQAIGTTPLTAGSLAMVSTHADGTSGMPVSGIEGANEVAINDDGSAVAFVSDVPAQDLVTDPVQLLRGVTDNNTDVGTTNKGDDIFVYQKLPGKSIISLVSENAAGTGTGNAPSDRPAMAPHGLGLVFQSSATDMVSGHVDANQNHIYAWVPALSSLTGVFLIDTKFNSSDACNCAATDPSISLFPPTVVFEATGDVNNELIAPGIDGENENQIYAHDIISGTNSLVSVTNDSHFPNARFANKADVGNGAPGGASQPMIAADAPVVVFQATGDDLIDGFENSNGPNIWVRNLVTGVTRLASEAVNGDPGGTDGNEDPVISALGTSVAWDSNGKNITSTPFPPTQLPPQGNVLPHIYFKVVFPAVSPTLLVDTDWTGGLACNANSGEPGLSGDGLSVVFQSDCSDITKPADLGGTTPDANNDSDVFERTLVPLPQAAPQLLSINDTGTGSGNGSSELCAPDDGNFTFPCQSSVNSGVSVNFDGSLVTYFTDATDIAAPAVGTPPFQSGSVIASYPKIPTGVKNVLLSTRNTDGAYAEDKAGDAVVSKDGSSVAFVSHATDLVANDNNDYFDAFESDLHNQFFFQPIDPVDEGAGSVTIGVIRTGNNGTDDSVEVKTGDGFDTSGIPDPFPGATEAKEPGDYTATDKTLHFPPGIDVQTFQVPIVDDGDVEGPEVFHVSLSTSGAGGAGLPGPLSDSYVEILDNDAAPQGWSVTTTTEPPATAHVGDTVTVKATIAVDAGADDLTVNSLASGAATSGLADVALDSTPFSVAAGTTKDVTANATVVAAPGASGTKLEIDVDGTLGATESVQSTDSTQIAVDEAVTAALTGGPASAGLSDPITYTLTLSNDSDTPAQVAVPAGGFAAPTGTTFSSRTDGSATIAAHAQTQYQLSVDVDPADGDGAVITQAPTGVTYAMSDVGLPSRSVTVTPQTTTVQAPVVAVTAHTLTDHDGGMLLAGDQVDVSVTVSNTGAADTTATLTDTITNLQSVSAIELDGAACGACSSSASAVTAPLGTLSAGGSHTITYSAVVKNVADGSTVASSSTVAFSPATTGTSPTTADVASLTVGSANTQDWHVAISQDPPASAPVGSTVTIKATISVDAGADDLSVTGVSSGAGTSGLDDVNFGSVPSSVPAGTSKVVTATARVTAAPGAGAHLQVSVDGTLGASSATKTAASADVTSTEAVTATLTGGPATVGIADQITYTLTATNTSDTDAQLGGLPAGLVAPAGSTQASRTDGTITVPANGTSTWSLTVDVDDADANGTVITQTPGALTYAMSDVGLAARTLAVTPPSVSSTVAVDNTKPDVTINQDSGQADPTNTSPIHFTAVFSEPVSGFGNGDVDVSTSTAGGMLAVSVTGGPTTYDVAVSGMTTDGSVTATIPAGVAQDAAANTNTASTSTDNSVMWTQKIPSSVGMTLSPPASVFGEAVHATATVGVTSGTPAGTVQFAVDGTDVGSPAAVGSGGLAMSPALTGSGGTPLAPGSRQVTATFVPSDPATYKGSSGATDLVVSKAATSTSVSVTAHALHATVAASAPGSGTPTGTVTFSVDGSTVGSAPLSGGAATLTFTTPSGKTHNVAATYGGSANYTASSASTARHDPSITATLSSAHARTSFGWYRASVKVTFTCTTHGAPLTAACPAAVTLTHSGAAQTVTRTITATDGGVATVSAHINIDLVHPTVKVKGVANGGRYTKPGPHATCSASDALSGVASCVLTRTSSTHSGVTTVHYTAVATDKAGNTASVHGSYQLAAITLTGAVYSDGAYTVHRGHTYVLVVYSTTRPAYYDAAPFPTIPFHPDRFAMHHAGHNLWSLPVTMTHSLSSHRYWNIGVKIGSTVHAIKIRAVA